MKLIIHAGMHKTGSSSIQHTLANIKSPGFHYVDWNIPNHSTLFALLFHDPVESYPIFKAKNITRNELEKRRELRLKLLRDELMNNNANVTVFSAEVISGERYADSVVRMKEFFLPFFDTIRIVAYIRPPIAYMHSAFQQRLKGPLSDFDIFSLWPNYRERFHKLDRIFGKSNVSLKPFYANELVDANVVKDFCNEIGITIENSSIRRVNESMSLEAASILFYYKYHLRKNTNHEPMPMSRNLLKEICAIPGSKLKFHPKLIEQVLAKNRDDIEWISARMERSMLDEDVVVSDNTVNYISSIDDLLKNAIENEVCIDKIITTVLRNNPLGQELSILKKFNALQALL